MQAGYTENTKRGSTTTEPGRRPVPVAQHAKQQQGRVILLGSTTLLEVQACGAPGLNHTGGRAGEGSSPFWGCGRKRTPCSRHTRWVQLSLPTTHGGAAFFSLVAPEGPTFNPDARHILGAATFD